MRWASQLPTGWSRGQYSSAHLHTRPLPSYPCHGLQISTPSASRFLLILPPHRNHGDLFVTALTLNLPCSKISSSHCLYDKDQAPRRACRPLGALPPCGVPPGQGHPSLLTLHCTIPSPGMSPGWVGPPPSPDCTVGKACALSHTPRQYPPHLGQDLAQRRKRKEAPSERPEAEVLSHGPRPAPVGSHRPH